MPDRGVESPLAIRRLKEGGYVVYIPPYREGMMTDLVFATHDIDPALNFIRNAIVPIHNIPEPVMQALSNNCQEISANFLNNNDLLKTWYRQS